MGKADLVEAAATMSRSVRFRRLEAEPWSLEVLEMGNCWWRENQMFSENQKNDLLRPEGTTIRLLTWGKIRLTAAGQRGEPEVSFVGAGMVRSFFCTKDNQMLEIKPESRW